MYLAASGVGHLTLADPDTVELTNLQRQIVHTTETLGQAKVDSAHRQLTALNPDIKIESLKSKLEGDALLRAVQNADVVVDGSDNFATRFAVNRACLAAKKTLVSGAVVRFEGQVSVFRADQDDAPCYECLYRNTGDNEGELCSQFGVLAPAAGLIGSIQAAETLKLLLGIGETLAGRLLAVDVLSMEFRTLKLRKDPDCPACRR